MVTGAFFEPKALCGSTSLLLAVPTGWEAGAGGEVAGTLFAGFAAGVGAGVACAGAGVCGSGCAGACCACCWGGAGATGSSAFLQPSTSSVSASSRLVCAMNQIERQLKSFSHDLSF